MPNQDIQGKANIPPFTYQNYPIDVVLRIYPEDNRYGMDVFALGQTMRFPIEVSPNDLTSWSQQLQDTIQTITRSVQSRKTLHYGDETPNAPDSTENDLRNLAELGNFVFKQVFGHPDALPIIEGLLALKDKLYIQVAAEDFILPWELLYSNSPDNPLDYRHFWGMNHVISRTIVQDHRPGAFVTPDIHFVSRPNIGVLANTRLIAVSQKEIPFFENLDRAKKIALFMLHVLDPTRKRDGLKKFKEFWTKPFHLAHLACHAFYNKDAPNQSYILLSDKFEVSLQDMVVYELSIPEHPLIIMNACETSDRNPLYTSNFAAAFLRHGARGVVATECEVPDAFAADFAEQLYGYLLKEEPLGESLLAARLHFLKQRDDPSGLIYSMYAPPSIRLVKDQETGESP